MVGLKKVMLIVSLGMSLSSASPKDSHSTTTELTEVLQQTEALSQISKKSSNSVREQVSPSLVTVNLKEELAGSPIWGEKSMIANTMGELLGYGQAETILTRYNNLGGGNLALKSSQQLKSNKITFPLIYPELKKYFPQKLEAIMQQKEFSSYKNQIRAGNILIVTQCGNKKHALAYYQGGRLKMATYVSIGRGNDKTIQGIYPVKHDKIRRRSARYSNAPMPYSLRIHGGYFLHQGTSDGTPKSKGCIRVPGLYQRWLYQALPKEGNTQVIMTELYSSLNGTQERKNNSYQTPPAPKKSTY